MKTTTIFRNEEKMTQEQVLDLFKKSMEATKVYEASEIEQLADAYAKNPVDKFIISEKLDVEAAQGDILIWAKGTTMYNENFKNLKNLKKTNRMVLQDGDSMTGDHRIVTISGTKLTIKEGEFTPAFLKGRNSWGDRTYRGLSVTSDKPFLIVHREHGNIALPAGEYMVCSAMDSTTLSRMMD